MSERQGCTNRLCCSLDKLPTVRPAFSESLYLYSLPSGDNLIRLRVLTFGTIIVNGNKTHCLLVVEISGARINLLLV